jgi:ADP-ribose pyrophosphatase YjhB (NUDIX family)
VVFDHRLIDTSTYADVQIFRRRRNERLRRETLTLPPMSPKHGPRIRTVPDGDTHERLVCPECSHVEYVNPKVVVGVVATLDDRILLCRRAIEPRRGFWTIPAGYLELRESPEEGAVREAREEAGASLEIDALLAVYSVKRVSQVQLIYRARLTDGEVEAGVESEEVRLFAREEIPWDELAFPTVRWALDHHHESRDREVFRPFANPPGDPGQAEFEH